MLMTLFQFSDELRWINTLLGAGNLFGESVAGQENSAAKDR
jgi:hypothetical protein